MANVHATQSHYDYAPEIRGAAGVLIAVPTIAVIARLYCRLSIKTLWWDDFWIISCLIASNGLQATCIHATFHGLGKDAGSVRSKAEGGKLSLLIIVALILFQVAISLLKLATLITYAYFFRIRQTFGRILWITAGVVFAWWLVMFVEPWVSCHPSSLRWGPFVPGACKTHVFAYNLAQSLINFILDLFILALPFPIIYELKLSTKRKAGLAGIFALGYCSTFISFTRLIFVIVHRNSVSVVGNPYVPARNIPLVFIGLIEVPIGLLALSVMPVANGYKHFKPRVVKIWQRYRFVKSSSPPIMMTMTAAPSRNRPQPPNQNSGDSRSALIPTYGISATKTSPVNSGHSTTTETYAERQIQAGRYLSLS